jgi:tricorn protease
MQSFRSVRFCTTVLLVSVFSLAAATSSAGNSGYYRFPAVYGNTILFTAEGDLWTVGVEGGEAKRLTSHLGMESYAAVSPDGSIVAFSGEYAGPTEVYTMPFGGGIPRRCTYDGNARVVGWTKAGKILYSTTRYSTLPNPQLLLFDPASGSSEILPLAQASDGSFDDKDQTLYFTRLAFQGSHTKRYKGGTAQNIWKFGPGAAEAIPLTGDYDGTSKDPLWYQGRIYFVSDRDGTMNLWSMGPEGKDLQQLTAHKGWDVKSPSLQGGRLVYQLGADIHLYDIVAKTDRLVPITLSSDFDQLREKWVKNPMEYMTSFGISPNGDRLVLTARGQVFVAPVEQGRFVQVTANNRVRYRSATFMPDGKKLLALSDETGETEFTLLSPNGVGNPQPLTNDAQVLRWGGEPSPDGKWIAFTDKNEELWVFDVVQKKDTRILKTLEGGPEGLAWSPDSKWLAYVKSARNFFSQICLYNVETGNTVELTSDRVDSFNPTWSPDGKWLYFLSDRVFQSVIQSPWGSRQPEPYFDKTRKVYALALVSGLRFPFQPADELFATQKADTTSSKKEKKEEPKAVVVKIDLAGLSERVFEVPLPAGAYNGLSVTEKYLFLGERQALYQGKTNLVSAEIKTKDVATKTVLEDIRSYDLSSDRKKIAVRKGDDLYVIEANGSAPGELPKSKVNLGNWMLSIDPRDEFRQMFLESWRLERDFFYDPKLHSIDYKGLLNRHLPLVERVADRDELSDLISSLVGELSALHIFVYGGDARRSPDRIGIATLGARLTRDEKAGGYRVTHIYRSDPEYLDVASPLAQPGIGVAEGDVILAINGVPSLSVPSPDPLLRNQAGQQVLLRVRATEGNKESDVIAKPISLGDEENLRYSEWEYTRRLRVEEAGKGELGYVHLRAMGGGNYGEWARNFYPVFDRKGLIIDVRHNRGGNIDSWILEKLLRKAWFYWQGRVGKPTWNMQYAFRGHMVVLCDERTASDGEAFTEGFRRLGLGKVIGTRTWGGEIWLSSNNFLVDRGIATAAESGVFGPEGEWLIEGRGVVPDVLVDNLPHATFAGEDAQLDAAIRHLQQLQKEKPVPDPQAPRYPDKSFKY